MEFFSGEEFNVIFNEVLDSNGACFDTLLTVCEKMLKGAVRRWCYSDSALRGRQYEEDIMQEIQIRLIKNCVTGFFNRNGEPNYDPDGFKNWVFTVAINVKNDFAKKVRRIQFKETEESEGDEPYYDDSLLGSDKTFERLNNAFKIVIESDSKVYKVLTWVAQMIIIADSNVTKIESNEILIKRFEVMTLDAMLALIVAQSQTIPWLKLEDSQIERIKKRLDEKGSDGQRIGDKAYGDFFMKKGAKASISDWVNRMNDYVMKEENLYDTSHC